MRLCSEWIKLADPSGKPHQLTKDIAVRRGPDGQYYVDRGVRPDFRLLGLALFVGVVLLFGMWARRYLVRPLSAPDWAGGLSQFVGPSLTGEGRRGDRG